MAGTVGDNGLPRRIFILPKEERDQGEVEDVNERREGECQTLLQMRAERGLWTWSLILSGFRGGRTHAYKLVAYPDFRKKLPLPKNARK